MQALQEVGKQLGLSLPNSTPSSSIIEQTLDALDLLVLHPHEQPLGLTIVNQLPVHALGSMGLSMRASNNVGEALQRLVRFHRLQNPFVEIALEHHEKGASISLRYHLPQRPCSTAIVETGLAMLVHLGQALCGPQWSPERVTFPHPVTNKEAWFQFFGTTVEQGSTASLYFTLEVLKQPTVSPDPMMSDFLDNSVKEKLQHLPEIPLTAQLRNWFINNLQTSPQGVDAAKALGMSRRTMYRKLRSLGTTFQKQLDMVRIEIAQKQLGEGISVGEVAFALGYSDTSSFCRAYRRWTGESPSRSRKDNELGWERR